LRRSTITTTKDDDMSLHGLALAHAEARMEERLQLAAARRTVRDARASRRGRRP
jgi:hypothetical protein